MKLDVDSVIKYLIRIMQNKNDNYFMEEALKEAQKAYNEDEVPVGCVIVKNDKIIARGHNKKEKYNNATLHAEIITLNKAQKKLNDWHLNDCTLYVTLEPCLMCTGAIIQTRIKKVVYGCLDPKGGAIESVMNIKEIDNLNHSFESISKVLEKDCSMILKNYFKSKRN